MKRWGLVLALAATCSSSPQDGDTGLPENEILGGLSLDEWRAVCKVIDQADIPRPEDVCRRMAFAATRTPAQSMGTEADVRATCQATYATCLRDTRPARPSTCPQRPLGPDCGASVGEAEQCLGTIIARRRMELQQIPGCDVLTVEQASNAGSTAPLSETDVPLLPPCMVVQQKCPAFFQ